MTSIGSSVAWTLFKPVQVPADYNPMDNADGWQSKPHDNPEYQQGMAALCGYNTREQWEPLGDFIVSAAHDKTAGIDPGDGFKNATFQDDGHHIHFEGVDGHQFVYGLNSVVSGDVDYQGDDVTKAHYNVTRDVKPGDPSYITAYKETGDVALDHGNLTVKSVYDDASLHKEEISTLGSDGASVYDGWQIAAGKADKQAVVSA